MNRRGSRRASADREITSQLRKVILSAAKPARERSEGDLVGTFQEILRCPQNDSSNNMEVIYLSSLTRQDWPVCRESLLIRAISASSLGDMSALSDTAVVGPGPVERFVASPMMIAERPPIARRRAGNPKVFRDLPWFAELAGQPASVAVGRVIRHALKVGASDVFLASTDEGVVVSLRRLGRVEHVGRLPPQHGLRCVTFVRTMAHMKLEENRRPQDGLWEFSADAQRRISLRVSTIPTMYGHSVAIRLLDLYGARRGLENLGLAGPQRETLVDLLASPGGLILVTGPTGSGKTTTLYACLEYLNDGTRKIHTLEDPVEYVLPGLYQTQVPDFSGAGFFELLRGVMRQNPDVIMIGEVRDPVTAETAVRAANSGQLVFATLHASVCATAVHNMLGYGVKAEFLASALSAIVGQRLVRVLAGGARRKPDPTARPDTFVDVRPWLGERHPATAYVPANPRGTDGGFVGQTGVYEVLRVTPAIRRLILDQAPADVIAGRALEEGMLDFRRAGLLQVAGGITSLGELRRCVPMNGHGFAARRI